jgi:hypothetical protein
MVLFINFNFTGYEIYFNIQMSWSGYSFNKSSSKTYLTIFCNIVHKI